MTSLPYDHCAAPVSAKSLAIDLLSTMPPHHPVPVGALVRAGALFEIGENSMRVTLARLRSRGLVESDRRGFYRLSRAALPVNRQVRSWPSIEEEASAWDGSWLAIETSELPRRDRRGARARERAMRLLGFEPLTKALRARPNNRVGGVAPCRERLVGLGFEPSPIVFRLADLDDDLERKARNLWDRYHLERVYRELRGRLAESAERLPTLSRRNAMAESFQLGGEVVRQLALDPLLPAEIIDVNARRALVEEMRRYDGIGRDYWKQWAGGTVEPERSPVDIGSFASTHESVPTPEHA